MKSTQYKSKTAVLDTYEHSNISDNSKPNSAKSDFVRNNDHYQYINTDNIQFKHNDKQQPTPKYNVVSLFSGLGGLDLGFKGGFEVFGREFESNPFELLFANDIFKQAADIYEANFKGHKVTRKSITDLELSDLPTAEVDVVLGGFPCQSFSYAGKRKGISDPRGQLYQQMLRVVKHYRPKIFVAENVDGIRNSRKNFDGDAVDVAAIDLILQEFAQAGYHVQYQVLNAAEYGVPQMRRRVIIIGLRADLGSIDDIYYPAHTHRNPLDTNSTNAALPLWLTAKDGIDDLWDRVNDPYLNAHSTKDISKAKFYPGKKMQGNNQIAADRPAPTIRAEHHGNIEAHYRSTKPEQPDDMQYWRRLSVRECARLQSFPDNFIFPVSASSAYKAVGNAVPPVLAWHIARAVAYSLNKISQSKN